MAITSYGSNRRPKTGNHRNQLTRTRNITLNNQLNFATKLLEKDSECAQRKLDERSKECIAELRTLRDDAKRLAKANIGNFWNDVSAPEKRRSDATKQRRAVSAPNKISSDKPTVRNMRRPKTAKSARVLKFKKLESFVPETEVFQVHCHKIKGPVLLRNFAANAPDLVPRNMNDFDDNAEWSDVLRAAEWLDGGAEGGGRGRHFNCKSPVVMAEFTERGKSKTVVEDNDDDVFADKPTTASITGDQVNVNENSVAQVSESNHMSPMERRLRWSNAIKNVVQATCTGQELSRKSTFSLEQMLKTHDREMRSSGMRSALESTSQLQQAKALQHMSGMEPVSERELKQKILNAQNVLQKDIETAKRAKNQQPVTIPAKVKPAETKRVEEPSSSKRELGRMSVLSSEGDSEEMDMFQTAILPNVRINDEMEKRVASYLEQMKPKKKASVAQKESVSSTSESETPLKVDSKYYDPPPVKQYTFDLERFRELRREQQVRRMMELDEEKRAQAESVTTRSLMRILRGTQQKLERLYQSRRELDASLKRVDKKRPPPPRVVYSIDDI